MNPSRRLLDILDSVRVWRVVWPFWLFWNLLASGWVKMRPGVLLAILALSWSVQGVLDLGVHYTKFAKWSG